MNVRAWPVVAGIFAVLWLFVRGVPLAPAAVAGQLLFGLAVGVPIAFVFRRLYAERLDLRDVVRAIPYAGLYLLTFGYELLRANLDVAYRVLAVDPPIEPEVIFLPLRVESAVAITVIANSITVTPGTLALDHDAEANGLFVHAIDGRDPAAIVAPIRRWEDYALEIFDERRSPADPAAPIVVGEPVEGDLADDHQQEEGSGGTREEDETDGWSGGRNR